MKKRNKRQERKPDAKNVTKTNSAETSGRDVTKSRSRSGGRRSLSSLLRLTSSRSTSEDGGGECNVDTETSGDGTRIDPRVNPRGHLQRMTVREALLYNRQRGRSPNRRALKLEKTLLNDDTRSSLSSSVPNLLEQISGQETHLASRQDYVKAGATLPRPKRNRTHTNENNNFKLLQSLGTKDCIQKQNAHPLDKQKYMINLKRSESRDNTPDLFSKEGRITLQTHSKPNHVQDNDASSSSRRRHESLSQFLALRDTSPPCSRSPSATRRTPAACERPTTKPLPTPDVHTGSQTSIQEAFNIQKCMATENNIRHPNNDGLQRVDQGRTPDAIYQDSAHGSKMRQRGTYVSPRRFTRSRSSVSSNVSDGASKDQAPATTPVSVEVPGAAHYQRQFSRASQRSVPGKTTQDTKDEFTLTDYDLYCMAHVDVMTQTDTLDHLLTRQEKTSTVEMSVQYDPADFGGESRSTDNDVDKGGIQKCIVVLDENHSSLLNRQRVDSAFKPIQSAKSVQPPDLKESVASHSLPDLTLVGKKSKKKDKSGKGRKGDSFNESDKRLVRSKTEKHKKEHKKGKNRKQRHSSEERLLKSHHEEEEPCSVTKQAPDASDTSLQKQTSRSRKKSRSSVRKAGKDKNKPHAPKRCASLGNVIEVRKEKESSQSAGLRKNDDLSRSLNSIHKKADKTVVDKISINKKESNDNDTKEAELPKPKLSLVAIVALKAKLARYKKAKQAEKSKQAENNEDENVNNFDGNADTTDLNIAKVYYDNEINTSIGKLSEKDGTDPEIQDLVYEKRISFARFPDDTMSEEELIKQRQRNTRLTNRRKSKVRQRQKKVINCCKKFVAFLFSHIGLCSLVVAYCILGGVIFKRLEGNQELQKKREMMELRQNYTVRIHRLAFEKTFTKSSSEDFKKNVDSILKEFSGSVYKQTKEAGWDGKDIYTGGDNSSEAQPEQWSYPSSLLYAITVMTTIGKSCSQYH